MRIQPIAEPDEEQQKLLSRTLPGPDGQPLNVFSTLAHYPELMKRVNALGGYFFVAGQLAVRDRELVILRVAAYANSDYELAQHRWIAPTAGLSVSEIDAAADPAVQHPWDPRDEACLALVEELLQGNSVSDATWATAANHFSLQERVELLALVGYYRMLAGILNGLQIPVDESVLKENHS